LTIDPLDFKVAPPFVDEEAVAEVALEGAELEVGFVEVSLGGGG